MCSIGNKKRPTITSVGPPTGDGNSRPPIFRRSHPGSRSVYPSATDCTSRWSRLVAELRPSSPGRQPRVERRRPARTLDQGAPRPFEPKCLNPPSRVNAPCSPGAARPQLSTRDRESFQNRMNAVTRVGSTVPSGGKRNTVGKKKANSKRNGRPCYYYCPPRRLRRPFIFSHL